MSGKSDLKRVAKEDGVFALLKSILAQFDAVATGAMGTEKSQFFMIPGRLVQAFRNKTFIEQLGVEVEQLRAKGKLRPDFEQSADGKSSLQELFAALEEPPVDDAKFQALKSIFIAAATGETSDGVPPQLILSVARSLSSGELIVLATAYRISREGFKHTVSESYVGWVKTIAEMSGIGLTGMIQDFAEQLAAKKLINPRHYGDGSGMSLGKHFGLTDFGIRLCELIERGTAELESVAKD
jgi:hypothetical protein